jgi:hypothetical protein
MTPAIRAVLFQPLSTVAALYKKLARPTAPYPAFVEGWAMNSFNGVSNLAPAAGGIGTDAQSQLQLEYTVSGASGATTLTIGAGDESKGTGTWGAVVQHDDATYGLYTIHSLAAGSATCFPPLRAAVTAKTLRNLTGSVNGQHYTEPAYKALARSIYARTKGDTYRMKYAARWRGAYGVKEDWTAYGGLGAGQFSISSPGAFLSGGNLQYMWTGRGLTCIAGTPTAPYTGKGLTKTFGLNGATGFLEAFISCATTTAFASFRVEVIVDGVTLHDQTYDANTGLLRLKVDYTNGVSGTLRVTRAAEEAALYQIRLWDVIWWAYDRSQTWTDPIIGKNEKVVVIGDSWTEFYSDGLGAEIQQAMTDDGGSGTVVSVGLSGQMAEWGLSNFDSLVAPEAPNVVVVLFFTNDRNVYLANTEPWLKAMYRIGLKCQAINARPVFIMPLPTASISQAATHGSWATQIGDGLPL